MYLPSPNQLSSPDAPTTRMSSIFNCLLLLLTPLAKAELTMLESDLAGLKLDKLRAEAELVEVVTLPDECQRSVSFEQDELFSVQDLVAQSVSIVSKSVTF